MKKPSNKLKLIWSTFALSCVCSILSIALGRGEATAGAVILAFAGMAGWLFKIRKDEKNAGLMDEETEKCKEEIK